MIVYDRDIEQGSEKWLELRRGIPTASRFKDIYTSTGKPSASAERYMYELAAERLAGRQLETYENEWMKRGTELEPEARAYAEISIGTEMDQVAFVTDDAGRYGCSPDGLFYRGQRLIGFETKSPAAHTHLKYLDKGRVPAEYVPQVQGSMMICGAEGWYFQSYHPDLPTLLLEAEPDTKWINGFEPVLLEFCEELEKLTTRLRSKT